MGTRFSVLGEVGNLEAPPGSREWAIAVRQEIRSTLNSVQGESKHIEEMVALMREHRGYRQLSDARGRPFATYEAFCCERQPFGLGYRPDDIARIVGERRAKEAKDRAENVLPLLPVGRPEGTNKPSVRSISYGETADYLTARIARDHPGILDRMKAGEFRSVRAAALEAGIVKPTASLPLDPIRAARIIRKHFTGEQWSALLAELRRLDAAATTGREPS